MKRITVIDNKTGIRSDYSNFSWNMAWASMFLIGIFIGAILF